MKELDFEEIINKANIIEQILKLRPDHTTIDVHKEDLALMRYWFSETTDYDRFHAMIEYAIPIETKNKARKLYREGKIS